MAQSAAEKQRRYRRHKAGDHSLCIPGNCPAVTPDVTDDVTDDAGNEPAPDLGRSGAWLWREMTRDGFPPPMQRLLLLEACRIADRLDRLDEQLQGEPWLRFLADEEGAEITVTIDKPLSEARQQAGALKALVAEYRQASSAKPSTPKRSSGGASTKGKGGGGLADITALIDQRRAAASD